MSVPPASARNAWSKYHAICSVRLRMAASARSSMAFTIQVGSLTVVQ
jgi:hypothetical protein